MSAKILYLVIYGLCRPEFLSIPHVVDPFAQISIMIPPITCINGYTRANIASIRIRGARLTSTKYIQILSNFDIVKRQFLLDLWFLLNSGLLFSKWKFS